MGPYQTEMHQVAASTFNRGKEVCGSISRKIQCQERFITAIFTYIFFLALNF